MNRFFDRKARRLPLLLAVVLLLSLGGTAALAGQLPAVPTFQSPPPTPPPNDSFANATAVTSLPFSDMVDVTYATTEANEPQNCNWSPQTVWYAFTPDADVFVRAYISELYDSNLSVWWAEAPGITGLQPITCSSWGSSVEFQVKAGVTFYFQVGKIYGGPGTLQINVEALPPPPNDNFASAKTITSPSSDGVDTLSATTEPGEPDPSCWTPVYRTVWYAFSPGTSGSFMIWAGGWSDRVLAVYTGADLTDLQEVGCRTFWGSGRVTFHADAGTPYFIQVGSMYNAGGWLDISLEVTPPPVASFGFSPWDPSIFDAVYFYDNSYDPADVGIQTVAWDFGDGTTSNDWSPAHRYAQDGDYTVNLTVTTYDGRTASTSQTVNVGTHDVAIVKLAAPNAAGVGQTRPIVVSIKNLRHPEQVHVELYKSVPGGFQWVASTEQNIPVRPGNRTTSVSLSYTFAGEDVVAGKVTFRATASILDHRDALPADNEAISSPTKVNK